MRASGGRRLRRCQGASDFLARRDNYRVISAHSRAPQGLRMVSFDSHVFPGVIRLLFGHPR